MLDPRSERNSFTAWNLPITSTRVKTTHAIRRCHAFFTGISYRARIIEKQAQSGSLSDMAWLLTRMDALPSSSLCCTAASCCSSASVLRHGGAGRLYMYDGSRFEY